MTTLKKAKGVAQCAIVILNWNGWKDTLLCLDSVSKLDSESFSVIVVDNASEDDSRAQILAWQPENMQMHLTAVVESGVALEESALAHNSWVYLQSPINGGFAYGNNLGIRLALQAGCEQVWLLNNDTVVDSQALNALQTVLAGDTQIGMCGSLLCFYDQPALVQAVGGVDFNLYTAIGQQRGQGLKRDDPVIAEMSASAPTYIAGASMLLSADCIQDVGLMEESYFLYFEEIDWAVRAQPRWKLATAINSVVYHKEGASIGTSSRSPRSRLSQYYLHRNLIRFYWLRKPSLLFVAIARVSKAIVSEIVGARWGVCRVTMKALFDGLIGKSGKVL